MIIINQSDKKMVKLMKVAKRLKAINGSEKVEMACCANVFPSMNNFAVATENKIIYFYGKGSNIYKSAIYRYDSITTVTQEDKGMGKFYISLIIGSGISTYLEILCSKDDAIEFCDFLYSKVKDSKLEPQNSSISMAEEIKKFKELLDIRAITQEEYDIKKNQILGM